MSELPPLTAEQARAVDRFAVDQLGLPSIVLMENAALNAASVVLDLLEDAVELHEDRYRVGVACGGGNNGGDGYALARHLLGFGVAVAVYAHKPLDQLTGDAAVNALCCARLGLPILACTTPEDLTGRTADFATCHVLVDALLGTGFTGTVRPDTAAVIDALNAAPTPGVAGEPRPRVVALDVPSGLDADTGQAAGPAVRADVTVTFVAPKAGFSHPQAAPYLGRVVIADIGLPDDAVRAALASG